MPVKSSGGARHVTRGGGPQPPIRFSSGQDLALLAGPSSAPGGAVTVTPGGAQGLDELTDANPAGTTFYLLAGKHVLTGAFAEFNQVSAKNNNRYVGAPGAILHGQGINNYAFTGDATGVTIEYLEITGFNAPIEQFVVNHNPGENWTIQYCNIHHNNGSSVGLGWGCTVRYSWLHDNSQYGFSSFSPPRDDGNGPGSGSGTGNVTVDHCEISFNGTLSDEVNPDGTFTFVGRNGGGKFWDCNGMTVTNNWVHHSNGVGIWADTNNIAMLLENNLIEDNAFEGFMYEISWNFKVSNNVFRRNAITKGKLFAAQTDNFPVACIYISNGGGESTISANYAQCEISGNWFIDNWGDITLWEANGRFCNTIANTSGKVWKPKQVVSGVRASLAICSQPSAKTLTVTLTSGQPTFVVTSGTFENTDEGRPVSGTGIPSGTEILEPTGAFGEAQYPGFQDATHGTMSKNATSSGSVTMTIAAGSVDTEPAKTACRWITQNISVHNNRFDHNAARVLGGFVLPNGVITGKIALISQYGTFPSWSPYLGDFISTDITFNRNNVFSRNTYTGNYRFMPFDTGHNLSFTEWRATPYSQDSGSTAQ